MRLTSSIAFLGDIGIFYLSLFLTLWIRYGASFYPQFIDRHAVPFTFICALWVLLIYIAGLYESRRFRNTIEFFKTLGLSFIVNVVVAVGFFYLVPQFGIAPKTNLFIFLLIFGALETAWRRVLNTSTAGRNPTTAILLIGDGGIVEEIAEYLRANAHLGYYVQFHFGADAIPPSLRSASAWKAFVREHHIELVVVPRRFKHDSDLSKILYELLAEDITITDTATFYELLFSRAPIHDVQEEWFLERLSDHHRFYDDLKRGAEFIFAVALGIVLLPLIALIALLVKLTSRGPVIYRQVRVGRHGEHFMLYKFRTMREDAEKNGAQWKTNGAVDPRFTVIGRRLAMLHFDEFPQLWNVIRGDLSFIGPRPERPEFTAVLATRIPYYDIRHIIRPGVTGWAQINFRYGASVEDSAEKLKYDIYYISHRSIVLDLAIILKTLKTIFATPT